MISELIKLKDLGYEKIEIRYSGGGDSGQIDEIFAIVGDDEDDVTDIENINCSILEQGVYAHLLDSIEDWWNNEGGYGVATIYLNDLSYSIDNHIRVEHYEDYYHEGNLELDETE